MFKRLLHVLRGRKARGGKVPPYRSREGERMVILSEGWVSPEVYDRLSEDVIRKINQSLRSQKFDSR